MNIEQLQAKREGFLASARELAAGDGDLAQVKSLMAEAKNIEERIETIKSLGVTAPIASASREISSRLRQARVSPTLRP